MPKKVHVPTSSEAMAMEVFELFKEKEKEVFSLSTYKSAFADVAHKHGIWHHEDAKEYNRFFGWVMTAVKVLIEKHIAKKEKKSRKDSKREIRIPTLEPISPNELKHNLTLDF